jgi:hypothetical protein
MSFTQLNPPLLVHVIDQGDGYALAVMGRSVALHAG